MAATSNETECDSKDLGVAKKTLTEEEESMVELYQSWNLEKEQPGIIQYMLDFGRNHLDLGPTEPVIPETEAAPAAQDISAPLTPEEPETLENASINQPVAQSLSSIPEETKEQAQQVSAGPSEPERRVKPARASRRTQRESIPRFAVPIGKPRIAAIRYAQQNPQPPKEKHHQQEQNEQVDNTEEDSDIVTGEGWIRLTPKIASSMTPHSVPLQRQTTLQVVPGISQSPFTRPKSPPALKGAVRPPDSPPPPETQPKAVRTVEQITLRRGVVINTEPLAVQIRLVGPPPAPQPAAQQGAMRSAPSASNRRPNNENRKPARRSGRRR